MRDAHVVFWDFEGVDGGRVASPRLGVTLALVESVSLPLLTARGAFRRFAVAQFVAHDGAADSEWRSLTRGDGAAVNVLYQDTEDRTGWLEDCIADTRRRYRAEIAARDFAAAGLEVGAG